MEDQAEAWAIPENKIKLRYHVKYSPLDFSPIQGAAEYREALLLKDRPRDEPLWDLARAGPSCAKIDYKRELETNGIFLKEMRRREVVLRKKFDSQYEELLLSEEDLRTHFKRFNRFIKENKDKTERAKRKLVIEDKVHDQLRCEIRNLSEQVDFYEKVKENLLYNINKYKIYERYLEQVVEESTNFRTVSDTYKRFEALISAREEISMAQRNNMRSIEKTLNEILTLSSEKTQKIIMLNTELAVMEKRYRIVKSRSMNWENLIVRVKDHVYNKESEIHVVKDVVWDMYVELVRRRRIGNVDVEPDNMDGQLKYIQTSINELRLIVEEAKIINAKERLLEIEETPSELKIEFQPTIVVDPPEEAEEEDFKL